MASVTDFRTRVLERQGLDPLNTNHEVLTRKYTTDNECCCCGQPGPNETYFEVVVNGYVVFSVKIDPACAEPTKELEEWLTQPMSEKQ